MERIVEGFVHAWHGIIYILGNERNARIHLVFAIAAFCLGVALRVSDVELAAIFFAVILVFFAEIVNTSFEKTLDIIDANHHPQIKLIKDMAAGAVLITSLAAAMIGFVIFVPHLVRLWVG
jgi:diacylglycerol kinase (ATP)